MPKQVKPTIMFLILDYVYMKMKTDLKRKLLVIDEAWTLLSRAEEASYIFEIVKTCRKFNMGLFLINQEVEGILNSQAGRSVLANSSYIILLRQKPAVIDEVQKTFNLSNVERIALLTAGIGEGILLMEDEHSELKVVASREEHKQITTNADELLKIEPKKEPKSKKINIKVDYRKRVHRSRNLSPVEKNYLVRKGFRKKFFKSVSSKKQEGYFIKPRFNETPKHLFVTYDIVEFLKSNNIKTELFVTKKPDIVFEINKKKYAIEIETGAVLSKIKNLEEKVRLLNENYSQWFFVVTNINKVKKYKKFGDAVDIRYLKTKLNRIIKFAKNTQN